MNTLLSFKTNTKLLLAAAMLFLAFGAQAQYKTKRIGNKPRNGSSNSTFAVKKGDQVAIKMDAGKKPVQLLKLDFGANNTRSDTVKFKVNVYPFKDVTPGKNLVTQEIIGQIIPGKQRVEVNLEPYNITASGDILVAIEWLNNRGGAEMSFSIGLFNGGTYHYEIDTWKKMPVAGVDFNVLVKK
ncbi:hypothetical protein GCM10023149_49230 [Mucilaginibacter gynuensis]|uniref:Uncharacterized protein n=1 Tax=Mucilaginibacter gynuensis TaxID=1302236 RepID=A0ABP8HG81_9SPHI